MDFTKLTNLLDAIPNHTAPGVDCIVKKGYDTVYRHHFGYSDREKKKEMNGSESFFLYSATKLITCTAALQLFEQGKFLLSDPVYEYIPEFRHMVIDKALPNGTHQLVEARKPITIADLFSMSAGLNYNIHSPSVEEVVRKTDRRAPTLDIIRAIASEPLCYEPGTQWQYSLAHDVLGGLIEVISGKWFGNYLSENIFSPLGMRNTGFSVSNETWGKMMQQYRFNVNKRVAEPIGLANEFVLGPDYQSGGAGLISTVEDYSLFAEALANGGEGASGAQILSSATIDLMRENRLNEKQLDDLNWEQLIGYGYGLGVRTLIDRAKAGSNSPLGEFGWSGAAGAYVLIDPSNNISMFYTQHMLESQGKYVHPRLRNVLYACL